MPDVSDRLQAGLAGRYVIQRELGHGGMATVYLGPERFLREIKLAARIQHPHVLSVHDSGETGGLLWLTMPFIEGESLRVSSGRYAEATRSSAQVSS